MPNADVKVPPLYYHEVKAHLGALDASFRALGKLAQGLSADLGRVAENVAYPEQIKRAVAGASADIYAVRKKLQIAAMELYSLTETTDA